MVIFELLDEVVRLHHFGSVEIPRWTSVTAQRSTEVPGRGARRNLEAENVTHLVEWSTPGWHA